jgi:hypothetical protein
MATRSGGDAMSRTPKWMMQRECRTCGAIIDAGERRCKSPTHRVKHGRELGMTINAPQGSIQAAHFHHLAKSMRNGSWANTNYRAAYSEGRQQMGRVHQEFGGRFAIERPPRPIRSFKDIQYFVFRCQLAKESLRDEFAGLMGMRLTLWLGGCTNQEVADRLQIPLDSLRWLDREIRGYYRINFPTRHTLQDAELLQSYRKMKAGVAADIIRRRQHGYKQSQVLQPQQVNPFSGKLMPIYEGGKHAHGSDSTDQALYDFCDDASRREEYRINETE